MKNRISVLVFLFCLTNSYAKYALPELTVEALSGGGLRASMPVLPGEEVQLFGFHANINKDIRGKEQGDISRSATKPLNNRWTIQDSKVQLKTGDKLHYWVFAQNNRLGFDKEDQVYEITGFTDTSAEPACVSSPSRKHDKTEKELCINEIILEDDFVDNKLDDSVWQVLQYTPQYALPGKEFVYYRKDSKNIYFDKNILHIKPIYEKHTTLPLDLSNGCTSKPEACRIDNDSSSWKIAPLVSSARIRTKIAFKYGRVEIKAKLPTGDWIVPHIVLEPKDYAYGEGIGESGEMYIAYSRGNNKLTRANGDSDGSRILYSGPALSTDRTKHMEKFSSSSAWGASYHTYSIEWGPDSLIYRIDNRISKNVTIEEGYSSLVKDTSYSGKWTTKNAPFDKYFYLTLGVSVGGAIDFGDIVNKPWSNTDLRAPITFKKIANSWASTWNEDSTLKVEYVKVYAV